MLYGKYEQVKLLARTLRKDSTEAEKKFWEIIRDKEILGLKFLRQRPIKYEYEGKVKFFIPDFYCSAIKLIVEIDGSIHDKQVEYDQERTRILNSLGYGVIRFKNKEINDSERIKNIMTDLCKRVVSGSPPYVIERG